MNTIDVDKLENALLVNRGELFRLGSALIFIVGIMLFTIARSDGGPHGTLLVIAAMIGGYMALNIGANDVAVPGLPVNTDLLVQLTEDLIEPGATA